MIHCFDGVILIFFKHRAIPLIYWFDLWNLEIHDLGRSPLKWNRNVVISISIKMIQMIKQVYAGANCFKHRTSNSKSELKSRDIWQYASIAIFSGNRYIYIDNIWRSIFSDSRRISIAFINVYCTCYNLKSRLNTSISIIINKSKTNVWIHRSHDINFVSEEKPTARIWIFFLKISIDTMYWYILNFHWSWINKETISYKWKSQIYVNYTHSCEFTYVVFFLSYCAAYPFALALVCQLTLILVFSWTGTQTGNTNCQPIEFIRAQGNISINVSWYTNTSINGSRMFSVSRTKFT